MILFGLSHLLMEVSSIYGISQIVHGVVTCKIEYKGTVVHWLNYQLLNYHIWSTFICRHTHTHTQTQYSVYYEQKGKNLNTWLFPCNTLTYKYIHVHYTHTHIHTYTHTHTHTHTHIDPCPLKCETIQCCI